MKHQFGRSMTEMLGVLAIVGVLSIGALVGLKYAFMKHQSNLIIEDVKLAGFIVKDELFETLPMSEEKNLTGYFTPQTTYPFATFKETDTTYTIVIDGIVENLCLDLKKRKVEWLEEIRANGQENTCRANDSNSMSFFFNVQLNTEKSLDYCLKDTDCGECGKCEKRQCQYGVKSGENCQLCSGKRYLSNVQFTDCKACGNRFWNGTYENDSSLGLCYFCDGVVSDDGTKCDWQCPDGQIGGYTGSGESKCYDCNTGVYKSSLTSCRGCDKMFYIGESELGETCALCTQEYMHGTSKTRLSDCLKCGNRTWIGTNTGEDSLGYCANCEGTLVENATKCDWQCPAGQVGGRSGSGESKCYDCNTGVYKSSLTSCRGCDKMFYNGENILDGECQLCSSTSIFRRVRFSDCVACGNRYWTGSYVNEDSLGNCYFCTGTVSSDGTQCITE